MNMNQAKTITVAFDGGTPCNNPRNYGNGYGSFAFNDKKPWRVAFGEPMSCNAAEVMTLVVALRIIILVEHNSHNVSLVITGDSRIALGRCKKKNVPSAKTSSAYADACGELAILCQQFRSIKTQWRPRGQSVTQFGH